MYVIATPTRYLITAVGFSADAFAQQFAVTIGGPGGCITVCNTTDWLFAIRVYQNARRQILATPTRAFEATITELLEAGN